MKDLIVENRKVVGVRVCDASENSDNDNHELFCDGVVLAVGHSARDVYQMLLQHDIELVPKDFAVSSLCFYAQTKIFWNLYRGNNSYPCAIDACGSSMISSFIHSLMYFEFLITCILIIWHFFSGWIAN